METKMEEIHIPDAPDLPGVCYRRFRGSEDYPGMLAVIQASKLADGVERSDTLEELANNYSHLSHCDPYRDMVMIDHEGKLIGYTRMECNQQSNPDVMLCWHLAFLHPDWRRKGIGRAILHYNENHLRKLAGEHQTDLPFYLGVDANDSEVGKNALFLAEGYQPVRHFYKMVRPSLEDIPNAPLPEGIEVRPVEPEHYRPVWDEMQVAFRDHWGYSPESESDYEGWQKSSSFQPDLWQVAWDGNIVVGTVLGYITENENREYGLRRGYTEDITVRREYRGRGIARALIACCLRALKDRGMTEAALFVDTENLSGALRLYEGMGYRPVVRSTHYRKPLN